MELEERPAKKRRFFVEEESPPPSPPPPKEASNAVTDGSAQERGGAAEDDGGDAGFNVELFEAFVGEQVDAQALQRLKEMSGGNVERAVNLWLDGSVKASLPALTEPTPPTSSSKDIAATRVVDSSSTPDEATNIPDSEDTISKTPPEPAKSGRQRNVPRGSIPEKRYIGAFGVVGWATRSGTNLIKHGDLVKIGRAKSQPSLKVGKGGKPVALKRQDTIVRFTTTRGEEVGRLETDFAAWIAPLLDQGICDLEGTCVFAPDKLRTNDTVYLQLRASLLKKMFEPSGFVKPAESNRQTGIFEAKETDDERNLRLRQIALVRLFEEINLHPSKGSSTTVKNQRKGILQAAEASEANEEKKATEQSDPNNAGNGGSSPPSEDAEEGEELEQDQLDTLYSKAQSFDFNTPEYEPAATFSMDLRKYQRQALHWMIGKERDTKANSAEMSMHPLWEEYVWPTKDVDDKVLSMFDGQQFFFVNPYSGELSLDFPLQEQHCLGGILADEMGLGKTIEMLSLIHSNKSEVAMKKPDKRADDTLNSLPRLPMSSASVEPAPCTTLVVAPMSLLSQWQSEAERASKAGTAKALVYYGGDRAVNLQSLCCEGNAANAPDIIITSYGIVLSEFGQVANNGGNRGSHGGLFSLEYFRVILDEAHMIKNRQSKTAKACYEIHAKHRWVLTGTPIVNRLEDLFSLVHFLRVEPWSNFSFWKTFITTPFESGEYIKALDVVQTVLEPLVLRRTKDMKTPDGEALVPLPPRTIDIEKVELSENERDVYNLIFHRAKKTFTANVQAGTLMKSYTTIFAQILRLRQSCCHPVLVRNKDIVQDEEDAAAASDAAAGLADDMDLANLIERFRAEEEDQDVGANKFGVHALKQIQDEAENECPICAEEPMIEQTVTGCWHSACKRCLVDYIAHQKGKEELPRCFNCREPINSRDLFEVVRDEEHGDDFVPRKVPKQTSDSEDESVDSILADEKDKDKPSISLRRINQVSSAKITALIEHLTTLRKIQPEVKSVVFSQFTSFIDLIEPYLTRSRIKFLRLDGSMPQKQRAAVINDFSTSDDSSRSKRSRATVLLLSLRAGGVGLNLTAAQRVFMMDPWWSWAVEAQAIDRVHRMGQDKAVKVVRFVCGESIEEKMLKIQERKKLIASSLGMMSEEEKRVQRLEDIKELLSE